MQGACMQASEGSHQYLSPWWAVLRRMYACVRALIWGEDFSSDPASKAIGYTLKYFSRGTLSIPVTQLSQVRVPPCVAAS